jgi:site-specific DNA-methyltransferase (adenine-specific)
VTDPPYALVSIQKRFTTVSALDVDVARKTPHRRTSGGFMGKQWDTGETAFDPEFWKQVLRVLKPGGHLVAFGGTRSYHRLACAIEDADFEIRDCLQYLYGSGFPKSHNIGNGWGTALKPACEPIVLARKPLSESTIAANVLRWGTGALNVDGCRVESEPIRTTRNTALGVLNDDGWQPKPAVFESHASGRWPANVLHDGSDEVVGAFPESDSTAAREHKPMKRQDNEVYGKGLGTISPDNTYSDSGSAARFFYTSKADSDDRLGFTHPTIKPVDLMQWLVRLVTPKNGLVLDPFAGTGTTGEAAFREGMRAMLFEREPEYQGFIRERMRLCLAGPDERRVATIKRKPEPPKDGLLAMMEEPA